MDVDPHPDHEALQKGVREPVARFDDEYRVVQTHGGFGYAVEYHVERYFREARLMRIAPISQELVLNDVSKNVLGLPRSYRGGGRTGAPARGRCTRYAVNDRSVAEKVTMPPSRARSTDAEPAARRRLVDTGRERAILSAATRLFHERGFHRVGVDEIGELAGITGPAIYRHFTGKDEILATLFDAALDRLLLLCGPLPDEPFAALDRLIVAHAEFAVHHRALLSVYAREERSLAEPWRRALQRRQREHVERWLDVLTRCYPDRAAVERAAAAHAAIGMVHSVAGWPRSAREGLDLSRTLAELVRSGLRALGPGGHRAVPHAGGETGA